MLFFGPGQANGGDVTPPSSGLTQATPNSASPAPRLADAYFDFDFADAMTEMEKKKGKRTDLVQQVLTQLDGVTTEEDMGKKIFPRNLFHGLRTPRETADTIRSWLEQAWQDGQTLSHRELAAQAAFDMNLLGPSLWTRAVEAVAMHDGIDPESLNLALEANLGFLEHFNTRLKHTRESTHRGVSPNPSVMLGAAVSAKKSHIIEFTDGLLANAEPLDQDGKPGFIAQRCLVVSDATLAGIRKALRRHCATGATKHAKTCVR